MRESDSYAFREEISPDMTKKILCVLPTVTDPRAALRIQMLEQAGFQVEAVAFETRYYPGKTLDCPVQSLGRLRFSRYYFRIPEITAHAPRIRAAIRRNDIVYIFHFDMFMAALPAAAGLGKTVVLEVHDINPHQVARGLKGGLVRFIDRFATKACQLLVLTSDGFYAYYRDCLNAGIPSLVIENKVGASFAAAVQKEGIPTLAGKPLDSRPLRIGYFGFLRDEWSMRLLEKLAASAPDRFEIFIAGVPHHSLMSKDDFLQRVSQNPNLHYQGPYRHPDDLPGLYASVDAVLNCIPPYPPYSWSQMNRYYDACLFQKPLIVRAGTKDADEVARRQIGLVIAADDAGDAAAAICRAASADWERWRRNMAALPPQVYAYTDEDALKLGQAVRKAAGMDAHG